MPSRLETLLASRMAGLKIGPGELLARDPPGGLAPPGLVSANRHCRLLKTGDGWVALNLARSDDSELVLALTGQGGDDPWNAVAMMAAQSDASGFCAWATELQLPVAIPGEAVPLELTNVVEARFSGRVLDMSALWAGPLCAGLLASLGADVVRIESVGRPDPTRQGSPKLDAMINCGKQIVPLDFRQVDGRRQLRDEVANADVLVTSARPAALARLGLDPVELAHKTWVAITAHGFSGPGALRVGFGDDCAVAGGLHDWILGEPRFIGDALADPLTGLEAARAVLAGRTGLIDMAMARVAAGYAAMLA